MTIYLKTKLPIKKIARIEDFKVHFARENKENNFPLKALLENKANNNWRGWQETRPKYNVFNRDYIFSLAKIYKEEDTWLFGGIFKVLKRYEGKNARYKVKLIEHGKEFIGRLKIRSSYKARTARVNMENHYEYFEVKKILATPYGRPQ